MTPRIALVGMASQYEVGFGDVPGLMAGTAKHLEAEGLAVVRTDTVLCDRESVERAAAALRGAEFDLLHVCVGTWSEDHHLLDLMDHFDRPAVIRAYPAVETGSLCGAQQLCSVLKELGRRYWFVYGDADDPQASAGTAVIARAAALAGRMKFVKIGTVGGRIKGMTEIAFDELELKDRTGARIVNLDEGDLAAAVGRQGESEARAVWETAKRRAGSVGVPDAQGIEAARHYLAMRGLVDEHGLEGLCVKCYPKQMGKICLGYSLLSEEGIVCGCEGDVNNTVAMKLLYELTGVPVHNTDLLHADPAGNTILFSHCGSGGFSIADCAGSVHLGPVRLAGSGVCALFPARPGRVTLANLVGRRGTLRLSVLTGDAVACGMEFPGNPLKVRFAKPVDEINRRIAGEGVGHHWMGGYGDVSEELRQFCALKGIRLVTPGE